jgi:hypothetical protein
VRVFLPSRERIKQPEGIELFDVDLATIRAHIAKLQALRKELRRSRKRLRTENALLVERIAERDAQLAAQRERYQWAANELLACDYGDSDRNEIGWVVYGWRDIRGGTGRRIYGPTIDAAIDAALKDRP